MAEKHVPLEARGISRDFDGVRVLHDVSIDFLSGEVHAIIGENGAGKSTLMKILSGYLAPTAGEVLVDGKPVRFADSAAAEDLGVILIHQEMNLADDLSVSANIFLGRELRRGPLLDDREMERRASELLAELRTQVSPRARVGSLTVSERQMVEIAKALWRNARVLIMDEPTDVLTNRETEVLFALIRRLKSSGVTVIFISHKLPEVKEIADRVTVLRDGRLIATQMIADLDEDAMATLMVGRELSEMYPPKRIAADAEVVLELEDFTVPGWATGVSFALRRGEILGLAGLVGSGRTELFEGLLGLRPARGTVRLHGKAVRFRTPRDAARQGIAYVSEDRKGKGLLVDMRMKPNMSLLALERIARPFLSDRVEQQILEEGSSDFDIRTANRNAVVNTLSGGNQQKVVLAKTMQIDPEVIILDEPTRGIDIGTKREIYFLVERLAAQGKAIVLISSELPEIIGLAHRVVVMQSGEVTGILPAERLTEDEVVRYATGLRRDTKEPLRQARAEGQAR